MKKIAFLLGTLVLSTSASFGQIISPYMDITPEPGEVLTDLTTDVKVVIKNEVGDVSNAVIQTVGGFGFGQYAPDPVIVDAEIQEGKRVVNYQLTPELWSTPFNEEFNIQLIVVLSDEEGTPIEGPDGDYVMSMVNYSSKDKEAAALVAYFPNNSLIGREYSFAEAYENGVMYAYFSKAVTAPERIATIIYRDPDGEVAGTKTAQLTSQEWSDMDGLYQLSFDFASAVVSVDEIASIEIQLNPVKWFNPEKERIENITSPVIVLNNPDVTPQAAPRKVKKGVANGLAVGTESVNVYNLQGMLVVKNASRDEVRNLAPGMYIINGQKVSVK